MLPHCVNVLPMRNPYTGAYARCASGGQSDTCCASEKRPSCYQAYKRDKSAASIVLHRSTVHINSSATTRTMSHCVSPESVARYSVITDQPNSRFHRRDISVKLSVSLTKWTLTWNSVKSVISL